MAGTYCVGYFRDTTAFFGVAYLNFPVGAQDFAFVLAASFESPFGVAFQSFFAATHGVRFGSFVGMSPG